MHQQTQATGRKEDHAAYLSKKKKRGGEAFTCALVLFCSKPLRFRTRVESPKNFRILNKKRLEISVRVRHT